jgi:2-polyprenyl-3-methyl-5-hydroxy-6-metoxy-1,4-benzoquinol methylase
VKASQTLEEQTVACYQRLRVQEETNRDNILTNREVLFQSLASEWCLVSALRCAQVEVRSAKVLDIGCGGGASLTVLMRLGILPWNLTGQEIREKEVILAKKMHPNVNLVCGDASRMNFCDQSFDIVTESTMFIHITDDRIAQRIAAEMIRVVKVGGHIILLDWRYAKPGNRDYTALSRQRVRTLFKVSSATEIQGEFNGSLVPPVGRFLSKRVPSVYFVVHRLLPFLVGQTAVVLVRK